MGERKRKTGGNKKRKWEGKVKQMQNREELGRKEHDRSRKMAIACSVSDPDLVGSAFNFGQDPDPYSGSRCLKIGLKR
jgi:hypothetical protein